MKTLARCDQHALKSITRLTLRSYTWGQTAAFFFSNQCLVFYTCGPLGSQFHPFFGAKVVGNLSVLSSWGSANQIHVGLPELTLLTFLLCLCTLGGLLMTFTDTILYLALRTPHTELPSLPYCIWACLKPGSLLMALQGDTQHWDQPESRCLVYCWKQLKSSIKICKW